MIRKGEYMVSVQIPAEIRAYKSKLIFGLSVRQVIAIAVALAICVPLGIFGHNYLSDDLLIWLIIMTSAPIAAWGFLSFQDMKFEEWVKVMLRYLFLPQKRVFEDTESNLFCHIHEDIIEEEIIEQRLENGEYERTGGQN